jgi:hypothetical protein
MSNFFERVSVNILERGRNIIANKMLIFASIINLVDYSPHDRQVKKLHHHGEVVCGNKKSNLHWIGYTQVLNICNLCGSVEWELHAGKDVRERERERERERAACWNFGILTTKFKTFANHGNWSLWVNDTNSCPWVLPCQLPLTPQLLAFCVHSTYVSWFWGIELWLVTLHKLVVIKFTYIGNLHLWVTSCYRSGKWRKQKTDQIQKQHQAQSQLKEFQIKSCNL